MRFDVTWTRPGEDEGEWFTCSNLTPLQLARRLYAAVNNFGSVTIVGIHKRPE